MSSSQRFKVSGFTMTELMVTIALLGLFAAFAIPSFTRFVASQRVDTNARSVANLLSFSRAEAVRLNLPVEVCPLNAAAGTLQTLGCQATSNWATGLLAFAGIVEPEIPGYRNGKAVRRILFDASQVTVTGAVYQGTAMQNATVSSNLNFSPEGIFADGTSRAKFLIRSVSDNTICSVVILNNSGRARVCQDQLNECVCALNAVML